MVYRLQTKKSFSCYEDSIWTFFLIPKSVTMYNLCSDNQYPKEFPGLGQHQNWKQSSSECTLLKKQVIHDDIVIFSSEWPPANLDQL